VRDGNANNLYGLKERSIGTDSLVFLLQVLTLLRPKLTALMPDSQRTLCETFFRRVRSSVEQLQLYMHRSTLPILLVDSLDSLPRAVEASKWELRRVPEECSAYMHQLIQDTDRAWCELQSLPQV
jgi:hypothetical protein